MTPRTGSVASIAKAEVLLRRGPVPAGLLPYTSLELEIRSGGQVITRLELEPVVLPCEIIIDDFTSAPGNEVALTFRKNLKRAKPGDQSIAHEWAFWKLHHMYNEYLRTNDEKIKKQIIRFAREHKLETVYGK